MSAAWAAPGVRCVCIDDHWEPLLFQIPTRVPMLHEVLTVASVRVSPYGGLFLSFEEISVLQECDGFAAYITFTVQNFRPLIVRSQADDVALFAPLLDAEKPVEAS